MSKRISFIIINWNSQSLVVSQIEKLLTFPGGEIIVIDNHSQPGIDADVLSKYQAVHWILNQANLGFAQACNQGLSQANGEWLFFLNPDVIFDQVSDIDDMIKFGQDNQLVAISPLPKPNQVNNYAKYLPSPYNLLREFTPLGHFLPPLNGPKSLTGGMLMIKRDVLKNIGGWDNDFFMWFEDCDLTYRLITANYQVGWYQKSFNHLGGGSVSLLSQKKQKLWFFQSMQLYAKKHFGYFGQMWVKLICWWNLIFRNTPLSA